MLEATPINKRNNTIHLLILSIIRPRVKHLQTIFGLAWQNLIGLRSVKSHDLESQDLLADLSDQDATK